MNATWTIVGTSKNINNLEIHINPFRKNKLGKNFCRILRMKKAWKNIFEHLENKDFQLEIEIQFDIENGMTDFK